ncbi:MAG: c-type cytochrome [Anaerolineae bacterium]
MTETKPSVDQPKRKTNWLLLLVGLLIGGAGALLLTVFVGMPLALGHRNDLPLEKLYGDIAVGLAVKTQAGSAQNPLAANPRANESGRLAYTGSCSMCHGANGDGKGIFGQAIYPPATDLRASDTQGKSDAELFWIIKNGLSFAGMPGFGNQYSDQMIWSLVSYTRSFKDNPSGTAPTSFRGGPLDIPTPTTEQLAMADPNGDAIHRGAAVYFAAGCQNCHGPAGNAGSELGLRGGRGEGSDTVRRGRPGMPAYSPDQITDAQLSDLNAFLGTLGGR